VEVLVPVAEISRSQINKLGDRLRAAGPIVNGALVV